MKIFVTGHKGYLGSEFVKAYKKDYEVVGYDHKDGEDLLDYAKLKHKMIGCEQVVHLAAIPKPVEPLIRPYYDRIKSDPNIE